MFSTVSKNNVESEILLDVIIITLKNNNNCFAFVLWILLFMCSFPDIKVFISAPSFYIQARKMYDLLRENLIFSIISKNKNKNIKCIFLV